jgi:small nuclear ribonucleoprotein (snRNP)-like protein
MLVELKNGETLNGHLVTCDTWMNLTLKEVVQTSPVCFLLFFLSSGMGWRDWRFGEDGGGNGV